MANSLLPLDTLAATIKAHINAGEKAIDKAEEHYKAAGIHLMDARDQLKREGKTFSAFLISHRIGSSRAYELISMAKGEKTLKEVRKRGAARVREHTARKKSSPLANGKSKEIVQQDQFSPDDDAPLRLPDECERQRIYDASSEDVRSAVDAFLLLGRKERDTAWQLINLYDQLGGRPDKAADIPQQDKAPSLVDDGRSEIEEEPSAMSLIFQIHAIKETYADLCDLTGDMMEAIEDMYEDANHRQQEHWEKFCPLIEKIGSDAQKRMDLAWPVDDDGNNIETDYVEPPRDELVTELLAAHSTGELSPQLDNIQREAA